MQGTRDNLMKTKPSSVPQVLHIRASLDSFCQWLVPWKGLWDLGPKLCLTSVCWRVDLNAFVLSMALKKIQVKLWKTKPWLGRFHTGNEVNQVPSEGNKQNSVLQHWSALTDDFLAIIWPANSPLQIHVHLCLLVQFLWGYGPEVNVLKQLVWELWKVTKFTHEICDRHGTWDSIPHLVSFWIPLQFKEGLETQMPTPLFIQWMLPNLL